jgi:hypothetical protein
VSTVTTYPVDLTLVPWAPATSVAVYPRVSEQVLADMPPTGVPVVATNVVAPDRSLSFDLPEGDYYAVAPMTPGQRDYRYLAFRSEIPLEEFIPGPPGPLGPQGYPGPSGAQGAAGSAGHPRPARPRLDPWGQPGRRASGRQAPRGHPARRATPAPLGCPARRGSRVRRA